MREVVKVRVLEDPKFGLCHYCGFRVALRRVVTYYNTWPVEACMTCGQTIQRHTNWLRDANARYRQNRRVVANSEPSPADL